MQKIAIINIKSEGIRIIVMIPTPIRTRPSINPNGIIEIRTILYKKIKESEKLILKTNVPKE